MTGAATSLGSMHSGQCLDKYSLLHFSNYQGHHVQEGLCTFPDATKPGRSPLDNGVPLFCQFDENMTGFWPQFWYILPTLFKSYLDFTYHGLIWVFKFWHHHFSMPFVTSMVFLPKWSMLWLINLWCKPFWYNTTITRQCQKQTHHMESHALSKISREVQLCKLVNSQTSSSCYVLVGCNPLLFDCECNYC